MKKFLSVLLAVMMVLSTVSFAAPSAFGVIDTAVVDMPVEVAVEEVAEAELAADANSANYGELIFELNFDNISSWDAANVYFRNCGFVNPEAENYAALYQDGYIETGAFPNRTIKSKGNGDNYLEVSGASGYSLVALQANNTKNFQTKAGIYTLTADVYTENGAGLTTRFSTGYTEDTPKQNFSFVNGGWGTMVLQHDPSCFGNGGHATVFKSISEVGTVKLHLAGGKEDWVLGYDNIRLYYKPLTADVKVVAGNSTVTKTYSTTEEVAVSELAAVAKVGLLYDVKGVKIGEKTYGLNEKVLFTKNTTAEVLVEKIDAKYINDEYGVQLFNIDFEAEENGTFIANNADLTLKDAYKTPFTDKLFAHPYSGWFMASNSGKSYIKADPLNPNNKVVATEDSNDDGYPVFRIDTWVDYRKNYQWGFIESEEGIYTVVYDVMDTAGKLNFTERFGGNSSKFPAEADGVPYWSEKEDECAEYENKPVANEYRTNYSQYSSAYYGNLASTTEVSYIKVHAAAPVGTSYYLDNFKLYWKPVKGDLTIDVNGVNGVKVAKSELTDIATGTKVSDILAAAGVDYSAVVSPTFKFKGVALDAEGSKIYYPTDSLDFIGDSTVYLIFEEVDMTEWVDDNGILLYDINFNNLANGTELGTGTKVNTFGRVNPYIDGSENWYLNCSGFSAATIENGVAKFTKTSTNQWAQIQISNENGGNVLISDGAIFKFADMKIVSDITGISLGLTGYSKTWNGSSWTGSSGNQNSVNTIHNVTSGQWYSLSGSKVLEGLEYNSEGCTIYLPTYPAAGGDGDTFYLDNLKMYWKPATVNVTVLGGSNENYETVVLKNVSTTLSLAELLDKIPACEYGKVTGLLDANGKRVEKFGAAVDTTYTAIWTPFVYLAGAQEFPVDAKGISGGGSGQWSAGYGNTNEVGNGGIVTGAISWMYSNGWKSEGGNLFAITDTVAIGENNAGGTIAEWSVPAIHSIGDMIRENIVTNLAAGNDAQYVMVKYRYDNLPNLREVAANCPNPADKKYVLSDDGNSLTYYGRDGSTQYTFKMAPDYGKKYYIEQQDGSYSYAGGEEFHKNELMVEDVWYYDLIPFTGNMNTKGVKKVIVQTWNRFDAQITEYDYVRFVKLGEEETFEPDEPELPEYTVTIENNLNDLLPATIEKTAKGEVKVADLAKLVAAGNDKYQFLGFSYEEAGELITDETIALDGDITVYPVWAKYNVLYGLEFNEDKVMDDLNGKGFFWWNNYGNESGSNKYGVNIQGDIYNGLTWTNGVQRFAMANKNLHTGFDGTRWAYILSNDSAYAQAPVKGIAVKIKYTNVPDFSYCSGDGVSEDKMSHEVSNVADGTVDGTFKKTGVDLIEFNTRFTDDTWSGGVALKADLVEGEWIYAVLDVSGKTSFSEKTILDIFMDPVPFMWEGMVMEVDYIRLLGETGEIVTPKPDVTPTTSEEVSIRTASPAGIRFKASISVETNEVATEYGWVVARDVKVSAAGKTYDDITIDQTAFKVSVGYGRKDGVDIKKFFEEDDLSKIFTGVVYNIPAGMEADVLVARPFVKVDGEYVYGTAISASLATIATELGLTAADFTN